MSTAAHLVIGNGVNLNDWRLNARALGRRRVGLFLAGAFAAGMVPMVLLSLGLAHTAQGIRSESAALANGIAVLQPGLRQVAALQQELAVLRTLPELYRDANASRGRIRDFLMDLSALAPPGLLVDSIAFEGDVIELKGSVRSKAQAVDFVRGLKTRGWPAAVPSVSPLDDKRKVFQVLIRPKQKKSK